MYSKLRHIILCLISGWLLSSCVSDSPEASDETHGAELQFAGELTRSVTTNINTEGSRFSLFGEKKFQGESSVGGHIVIFDNTPVTYRGSGWTYGEPEYWFPQHEYSFVAVHPGAVFSESGADARYSDATLSFSYTLPVSEGDEVNIPDLADLVVAAHRRMYRESTSSAAPVKLNFFHILSRIDFRLKNDNVADILKVTKIELEGADRTGAFSITPAPILSSGTQTDDYNCYWAGISNRGTVTANIDADISRNEEISLFADDEAMFMIPQPDNKGVIVKISYTIVNAGKDDKEVTLTVDTPIGGWEMGKKYIYTVNVQERYITFTVNVADWKDGTENDLKVPRK